MWLEDTLGDDGNKVINGSNSGRIHETGHSLVDNFTMLVLQAVPTEQERDAEPGKKKRSFGAASGYTDTPGLALVRKLVEKRGMQDRIMSFVTNARGWSIAAGILSRFDSYEWPKSHIASPEHSFRKKWEAKGELEAISEPREIYRIETDSEYCSDSANDSEPESEGPAASRFDPPSYPSRPSRVPDRKRGHWPDLSFGTSVLR